MTKKLLALLLTLIPLAGVRAMDSVTLKDGRTLKGKVIRRNGIVTVVGAGGLFQFPESEIAGTEAAPAPTPAKPATSGEANPVVELKTSMGVLRIELFEDDAPNTVANFLELIGNGYYDGTRFHRVIEGFMIQGGDPNSKDDDPSDDGQGGPGYRFADEFSERHHEGPGVLSMANAGPGTNGSQFFVTLGPTPHLDGRHTVFGKVIEGLDVVKAIGTTPTTGRGGNPPDRPKKDVVLEKATIIRKRDHEYHVKKL